MTRPAWKPVSPRTDAQRPRVIARLEPPLGLAPWSASAGRATVEEVDGRRRLLLRGDRQKGLVIPGPIPAGGCDEVRLELAAQGRASAAAFLALGDQRTARTRQRAFGESDTPATLVLRLNESLDPDAVVESLTLGVSGLGPQALYGAVELVDVPLAARLHDPGGQPPLVKIDGVQRRAFGLAPGRAVEARVELAPDSALRFAAALHPEASFTGGATLIARAARDDGASVERSIALTLDADPAWRVVELALDALSPGPATLHLELAQPDGGEVACWIADPRVVALDARAPSVLLVTSDTHRADHVGSVARDERVRTPVIDALAADGVLFEDCFSSTNVTNPSHIALMTGVHPRDTGVHGNDTALIDEARTLAERFAAAGYATLASISVRHLSPEISGLGQGFECFAAPASQRDAVETVAALERWLDERPGEPVFAWLHLFDAHEPYIPPPELVAEFYPAERDPFDPSAPPLELPEEIYSKHFAGLRDLEYPLAMYRAEVASLDAQLARLFARPCFEAGVVALTADHGESLGEHGIYYGHTGLYPQSIHVPLVLRWPGAPGGARVTSPVRQIDVGRTLLELAGVDADAFPGEDLVAALTDARRAPRFAIGANRDSASVTVDGWHLILGLRSYHPKGSLYPVERHAVELYDLTADPECEAELSERELERARRMRELLLEWLADAGSVTLAGEIARDPELVKQLSELGYTTSDEGGSSSELVDEGCDCEHCARFR